MQSMDAADIVRISESVDKDHGVAPFYAAGIVWYINQFFTRAGSFFWHIYTFLLVFMGICSLYFLSKDLFSDSDVVQNKAGFSAASITSPLITLLFFLTPRMFAESHYNNKDMILLALVLTTLYTGHRLLRNLSLKNILLFAAAGAFTTNVKIIGAWLIIFMLITPAAWDGLLEYVLYNFSYAVNFDRWVGFILFDGRLLHTQYTGIPRKYLPVMILLTTPLGILLLITVGATLLLCKIYKARFKLSLQSEGYILLTSLAGFIPLIYAILSATPVYNGWRHFYFTYASMIIVAGYGLYRLLDWLFQKKKGILAVSIPAVYIGLLALSICLNHPYEYGYYNILAGKNVQHRYEMDYWELSAANAYESICSYGNTMCEVYKK